jgi:hypothetical protein
MFLDAKYESAKCVKQRSVLGSKVCVSLKDHPFKTSACLRGEGCPHVSMVKRSQYIRIKNPLHKHFAGMLMVGG